MSNQVIAFGEDSEKTFEKYFDITVKNKKYPSCYHYNILIMLAKRLINEKPQRVNPCFSRTKFEKQLNKRIINVVTA